MLTIYSRITHTFLLLISDLTQGLLTLYFVSTLGFTHTLLQVISNITPGLTLVFSWFYSRFTPALQTLNTWFNSHFTPGLLLLYSMWTPLLLLVYCNCAQGLLSLYSWFTLFSGFYSHHSCFANTLQWFTHTFHQVYANLTQSLFILYIRWTHNLLCIFTQFTPHLLSPYSGFTYTLLWVVSHISPSLPLLFLLVLLTLWTRLMDTLS